MATFDDLERSQRLSRPIYLYTWTTLGEVYHTTTHGTDVAFAGNTFTALPTIHEDEQTTQDASGDELIVSLPISHPLVQRYVSSGIPEQSVAVLVQRLQSAAATAVQAWSGQAQSIAIDGHWAKIRVPDALADALRTQLPVIAAQHQCQHALFDRGCAPNPGGDWPALSANSEGGPVSFLFQISTTVAAVSDDGLTITLADYGGNPDAFFQYGLITSNGTLTRPDARIPFGETRSITSHVGNVITLSVPFPATLADLQSVDMIVRAGCDHSIATCITKFANAANFGGHPHMTGAINPWSPNGVGTVTQV